MNTSQERKTMRDLRIVFMGTPDFAVSSLAALVDAGCNIVGVITAPDKPAGRGMKLTESAVKKFALEKGLNILQPKKLKNPAFIDTLKALKADLQVVVAFRMLPEIVWNMPGMGTINLHGSLLPQYRGAAPIHWAVINGEKETGVSTFKLQHIIDTGDILLQKSFPIGPDETTGEVHDRMKVIGAALLIETVKGIAENSLKETQQSTVAKEEELKHAPKLFTENCEVNWNQEIEKIHNFIRGLSPFPGALSKLDDKILKIYRSKKEASIIQENPGTVLSDGKTFLKIAAIDGYIHILDLQLEGKKRMITEDFLRGYRLMNT